MATRLVACVVGLWLVVRPAGAQGEERMEPVNPTISDAVQDRVVRALVEAHGPQVEARARQGVTQVARAWRAEDGDAEAFRSFCQEQFLADPAAVDLLLDRLERSFEALNGHAVALTRTLREPVDLDLFQTLPVDLLLASLNPFDHLSEDLYRTRIAFVALLNFPQVEPVRAGNLTRRQWAAVRLIQGMALRIPGDAKAAATRAYAEAEDYIARYNIPLAALVTPDGRHLFPGGPTLISHWGLRDHIKALYNDPKANLEGQRLIYRVMERIIRQEVPEAVVAGTEVLWDPTGNRVRFPGGDWTAADREPDRRYRKWLQVFQAERGQDRHSPRYPTHIARRFLWDRELPEEVVEGLLRDVLSAPVARDVAALIRQRLGRPLEPFDIWYDGFKARSTYDPATLDRMVRQRYPTLESFAQGLPALLEGLGFTPDTARFLSDHIAVDPARGAGHAMGAGMRTDSAHLRTRVPKEGMDYKGFNIAMHELGHCVEQVFTLNRVDHVLMAGVPNTAFTEAFAFLFQDRDMQVLGLGEPDAKTRALRAVDTYWMTFEIAGVGLLDMLAWRWLYAHPDATPDQLREAVVSLAVDLWNRYYAPVLGVRDSPVLAIYSHLIAYGLYLPDYPLGHLIQFQIEQFLEGGRALAPEMERMCVQGRLPPQVWMQGAVGEPLSAAPLITAARKGIQVLRKTRL
ncbi:MAG TPA: hypothetical protein PLQ97_10880 [Myxococcota bacterium]|nr:hypothetical protein [Myxococcota bacterium]HQK51555.1 hypothetical protein [Myxococcota bacterium]